MTETAAGRSFVGIDHGRPRAIADVPFDHKRHWTFVLAVLAIIAGFAAWAQYEYRRVPELLEAKVVSAYPHDPRAFTQGLAFHDGRIYEGTGQYGASSIRRVNYVTGVVEQMSVLDRRLFGEGIAILNGKLYQLTWQNQLGAVYDVDTFVLLETFSYQGEGWGLTHDGGQLIQSDGTATIRFLDPETFREMRRIDVRERSGRAVDRLNELEFVRGEIWANIWYEDRIARIAPDTGLILGWIDLSKLYPARLRNRDDVANGIAYDADADRLFVTGKNWPQLFQIELVEPRS